MTIQGSAALRSLTSEAGRQAEYYARRDMTILAGMWSEIERLAFAAGRANACLTISTPAEECPSIVKQGRNGDIPIPIKASEQVQQPHKHNVIKAFQ